MTTRILLTIAVLLTAVSAQGQFPKPGPEHEAMAALAGNWKGTASFQIPGMAEAATSEVTSTASMEYGGFWLVSTLEGSMMGMPFAGRSTMGFDPAQGKYVETWIDSMRPTIGNIDGDYDAATRKWTKWLRNGKHPITGVPAVERHTQQLIDDNTMVIELAMPGEAEGEYLPYMRVEMTRAE